MQYAETPESNHCGWEKQMELVDRGSRVEKMKLVGRLRVNKLLHKLWKSGTERHRKSYGSDGLTPGSFPYTIEKSLFKSSNFCTVYQNIFTAVFWRQDRRINLLPFLFLFSIHVHVEHVVCWKSYLAVRQANKKKFSLYLNPDKRHLFDSVTPSFTQVVRRKSVCSRV